MNTFWVKLLNCVLVLAAVFGFNSVVQSREQAETIAQLEFDLENQKQIAAAAAVATGTSDLEAVPEDEPAEPESKYHDGVYEGQAEGYGGPVVMEAVIENGVLTELNVVSADREDAAYFDAAVAVIDDILETQSIEVDAVSGATFSSNGIIQAAADALGKAEEAT